MYFQVNIHLFISLNVFVFRKIIIYFFQVSPGNLPKKASKAVAIEEEEIPILTLAPFTETPKLSFQDVAVNVLHEIKLNISNKKSVPAFVGIKLIINFYTTFLLQQFSGKHLF